MKRRIVSYFIGFILFNILLISPVLAAYSAVVTIAESAGTSYAMLPAITPLNTTGMITGGTIATATALDTRVGTGGAYIPHMMADNKLLFATPVTGFSTNPFDFTTGNAPLAAFDIIVGYGGYITVTDAATLEWGNNGSILQTAYFDTSVTNYHTKKQGAVDIYTDGAGNVVAGLNPTYSYALTVTKDGAYHDVDVSSYVASDANGVILEVYTDGTPELMTFRKNGSTDDRYYYSSHTWVFIGLDASRIFEAKIVNAGTAIVCLRGYTRTGGGWTFNTNATDVSIAAGAYTNIDVSASSPAGTVGVILQAVNKDAGTARGFAFRKDGSTDDRVGNLAINQLAYAVIGVNPATRIFEGFAATVDVDFYVIGYVTGGSTFATNATDKSIAAAAWTDIDVSAIAPAANYAFVEIYDAGGVSTSDVGLRKHESTEDIYTEMDGAHTWGIVETDTAQIFEGKVAAASLDFFVTGYSSSGIYPINPITTTYATSISQAVTAGEHERYVGLYSGYFKSYYNIITYYDKNDDTVTQIDSATKYKGESFTTGTTVYPITNISLLGYRVGAPGTITVSISAVDGAGAPTGAVLTSGTYNANLLGVAAAWFNVPITSWTPTASTQYALFINCPTAAVGQEFRWRLDQTAPAYAGGMYQTKNGAAWDAPTAGIDGLFFIGVGSSVAYAGSVTDNSQAWVITPQSYIDNYTHNVAGVEVVHYHPATYIVGTTLPDLTGAAENGAITWGANPTGVSIVIGALSYVSSGTSTSVGLPESVGAAGEINVGFEPREDAEMVGVPFLRPTVNYLTNYLGDPAWLWWLFIALCNCIIAMAVVFKYTQHLWFMCAAAIITLGGCAAAYMIQPAIILVVTGILLLPMLMERKPSW